MATFPARGTTPWDTELKTWLNVEHDDTGALKDVARPADLTGHTTNTANPHAVTKAQLGLGNVTNIPVDITVTVGEATNQLSLTATTTLVNLTTPVLATGTSYLIEADGWIEGYGSGALSTGHPRINIAGTTTTSPVALTWEHGVDGPKIQKAARTLTGAGVAETVSLIYVHATGSTSVVWAKLVMKATRVG